jgi:hypothetical protein
MDEYLTKVFQRLESDGFKVSKDITYGHHRFQYLAKRTRIEISKFGFIETYFIFNEYKDSELSSLHKFSNACVSYAIERSRIPLPRGFCKGIVCYSVSLIDSVDQATAKAIQTEEPPKHWATFEIPVVCDLSNRQLHYLEKTPSWGGLYWDHFRETIRYTLAP